MRTYYYIINGRKVEGKIYGLVKKTMTEAEAIEANARCMRLKLYGRWSAGYEQVNLWDTTKPA